MSAPVAFRRRLGSLGVFLGVYLLIAGLLGPTLVVVFDLGMVEPVTAGWPFASALFIIALMAALGFGASFAIGVFTPSRRAQYRRGRLLILALISALIALAAPFFPLIGLMQLGPLAEWLVPELVLHPWMLLSVCVFTIEALGLTLGRLTNRYS